jgi:hypothetical protein
MFVQISHYQITSGNRQKCIDLMNQLQPQIMALPGLKQFLNVIREDDSGYVIALIESKEQSQKNEPRVRELWSAFAGYLARLPAIELHEVMVDWRS